MNEKEICLKPKNKPIRITTKGVFIYLEHGFKTFIPLKTIQKMKGVINK